MGADRARVAEAPGYPREYALTPLAEELLAHHYLPGMPWGELDRMETPARETVIEFARWMEHRAQERDELLLTVLGAARVSG